MTQRLENTEKGSKNDITELFARIKRYEEEARIDNDEVRDDDHHKMMIMMMMRRIKRYEEEVKIDN